MIGGDSLELIQRSRRIHRDVRGDGTIWHPPARTVIDALVIATAGGTRAAIESQFDACRPMAYRTRSPDSPCRFSMNAAEQTAEQ